MKMIVFILRFLIYSLILGLFTFFEFYALSEFCFWVLRMLFNIKNSMNSLMFFFLVLLFGIGLIRLMYYALLNICGWILGLITFISPSDDYSIWLTKITSMVCFVYFLITIFADAEGFKVICICLLMTIMGFLMAAVNIEVVKAHSLKRLIMAETNPERKAILWEKYYNMIK